MPQNPIDAAVEAIATAHDDDATVDGALERFGAELGMALPLAAGQPGRLGALIDLAERLAAEPDSPTTPGWRAYIAAVREQRGRLAADEAGLVAEAERYLFGQ